MVDQQKIIEAIAESLTIPVADIDPAADLQDDMGLNLLEITDLLDDLAKNFNIIFEPSEMDGLQTIGDLINLIEDKSLE